MLLCKEGRQHPCVSTATPMQFCSSYCSSSAHQCCPASLLRTSRLLSGAVLLCKACRQHPCVSTATPMQFCSSYCLTSVAQHHCSEPVGCFLVQCCSAKHADSTLASAQPHLYSSALHTALLMLSSIAQHHSSEQQPELDRVTVPCCLSLHICMKCKTATH